MILADSNVLLDVITADPKWGRWSLAALDEWARRGPILVNPVIYAEIAPAYDGGARRGHRGRRPRTP